MIGSPKFMTELFNQWNYNFGYSSRTYGGIIQYLKFKNFFMFN